nr:putative zinc finger, CCHC-type [Tanacetum cinerariifolium]
MRDEHLNTILATKSDEFIKSSVENLVSNPSESKGKHKCDVPACEDFTIFSNLLFDVDYDFSSSDDQSFFDEDIPKEICSNPLFDEEIISMKIDPHHFNAESDLMESMLNHDSLIISSSSKIDSLFNEFVGELTLLKSIPPGINETDCDPEEETCLIKRLLYDNSSPRPPKEFIFENYDTAFESFSPKHPTCLNNPLRIVLSVDTRSMVIIVKDVLFSERNLRKIILHLVLKMEFSKILLSHPMTIPTLLMLFESHSNGAHYGYNCPPKVPIVPNLESFNNQTIEELPPTVPSFDPTCYSEDGNSFTYDSTSNLIHDSLNVFDPPPQLPFYSCEFCGNDARYGHYCTPQVPFIYPELCYNQDFNLPKDFHDFQQQDLCCENCGNGESVKDMTRKFDKLVKFEGQDFRRWQKKMHFLLTTLKVVYVLSTPSPVWSENETLETARKRMKWENDDYICRGPILNGMSDSLFDIYQNAKSAKALWESLESKYMAEDASVTKFLEELNLVQLGNHLRIEKGLRNQELDNNPKGKNQIGSSSVNKVEGDGAKNSNNNKNKRKFKSGDDKFANKKGIVTCWKCKKTGHMKKDCRSRKGNDGAGVRQELAHIISPPEYDRFYLKDLPDPGELMSVLNSGIRENLSTTSVNLPIEDDYSPLLAYVVWIFVAYLTYPIIPLYLHPFGKEDTIFDPGITINHFYSFKPGSSHRHGAFKKFNTHRSHLNEWPMIINGKNTPILDVLLYHFYPP